MTISRFKPLVWSGRVRPARTNPHRRHSASASLELRFSKGPTRGEADAAAHTHEVAVIAEVRRQVFLRDMTCTVCDGLRRRECVVTEDQMNEIIPRSKTRGLPPEERFNVHNCHRVCSACHQDITEKRITVSGDANVPGGLIVRGRP